MLYLLEVNIFTFSFYVYILVLLNFSLMIMIEKTNKDLNNYTQPLLLMSGI